jgi:hypothetical protein
MKILNSVFLIKHSHNCHTWTKKRDSFWQYRSQRDESTFKWLAVATPHDEKTVLSVLRVLLPIGNAIPQLHFPVSFGPQGTFAGIAIPDPFYRH